MRNRVDYSEKRQFGRRQTHMRGWIKVAGRPVIPCIVRNLSEGGALLECEDDIWLPFSFRLTSECRQIDRTCEIRHQSGARRFGVEFVETAEQSVAIMRGGGNDASAWMGQEASLLRR
jgi:hypothetical protein